MVVLSSELANTLYPVSLNLQNSQQLILLTSTQMDIDIEKTRGQSTHSSLNSFRESSTHSYALSVNYTAKVKAQSNSTT